MAQNDFLIMGNPKNMDWSNVEPVETTATKGNNPVQFEVTDTFLSSTEYMRRDPSDIIRVNNKYYIWYTKIHKDKPHYPGGWSGSVWYATSEDGHTWEEKGVAIDHSPQNSWDGHGVYTPNIMKYQEKFYLVYTAMPSPFDRKYSQASIGIAVSDSPDGPWVKSENNPIISPGSSLSEADGFLVDDAVFVLNHDKIYIYYKGYPKWIDQEGNNVRASGNTYLMVTKAENPEGPYVKHPLPLFRGHEAVVWKEKDGIGSFSIAWGANKYYKSGKGLLFHDASYSLLLNETNFKIQAAGIFREDFVNEENISRPKWGICMGPNNGLARFDIKWPE
jgi:hypothetical protein